MENENKMIYRADLPYPAIKVVEPNLRYAKILLNEYAGLNSEITAIMQYVYQHTILSKEYPDISDIIIQISKVEMRHMDLLGECILALGVDPKYRVIRNNRPIYWNGIYVNYSKNISKILLDDISSEQGAIESYRRDISMIKDENIDALLTRIIMDEEVHLKIFKRLIEKHST